MNAYVKIMYLCFLDYELVLNSLQTGTDPFVDHSSLDSLFY